MEGLREAGLGPAFTGMRSVLLIAIFGVFAASAASAQVVESNINVTGLGAEGYEPGQPGKQENEPSCAVNPLNELNVMCAYNWYGFADVPLKQGDTWIGFSETRDGRVFIRRPLTGTRDNSWTGKDFAADATMLAWPGGAAVTSIAGIRGGNSVMLIQRMMEVNSETGFRHLSEAGQIEIASISGVNFIDKPDARVIIDPNGGTQLVTMTLETGEIVDREWPNLRIIVTYAVFNGSNQNIRTYSTYSDEFGAAGSWSNPQQITNSSGLDQGLSVAHIENEILYTVRRFQAGTENDAIMGAVSNNRGQKIGKVFEITDICPFDQITLPDSAITEEAVSFRTNDFPWVSATGDTYVLAYSERPRDTNGNCIFNQGSRIMVRTSGNGTVWSPPIQVSPVAGHAFQFMPAINCARGACQVIWYDTRNESLAFESFLESGDPKHWEDNPYIEDFVSDDGKFQFRRTADVYTSRITIDTSGDPIASPIPERVSVYQYGVDRFANVFEREFNPVNVRNYGGNSKPFIGDYIAITSAAWRLKDDGVSWESNQSAIGNIELDKVNYFGAWTDNRRIRGASLGSYPYTTATPFNVSPNVVVELNTAVPEGEVKQLPAGIEPGGPAPQVKAEILAKNTDRFLSAYMPRAEGLEDRNMNPGTCVPTAEPAPFAATAPFETRTKNSEIYGAMIEDRIRLVSPTPAKNLGQIQRAFVLGIENIDPVNDANFKLVIANQPGNAPVGDGDPSFLVDARASWRQLPFGPVFDPDPNRLPEPEPAPTITEFLTVPAQSTDYITLFVVAPSPADFGPSPITVYAYDENDVLVAAITVNGETEAGDLLGTFQGADVAITEIHDPGLLLPVWSELTVNQLNPDYLNPRLRNPRLRNPRLRNPRLRNTDFQDASMRNPRLRNESFQNETADVTDIQNSTLRDPDLTVIDSFVDVTFGVEGNSNTITANDADFAFAGDEFEGFDTQLIVWQENEIESLQNCDYGQITENNVIAAVNNPRLRNLTIPDIDNNLDGAIRFPVAPEEIVKLTLRIFGLKADLDELIKVTVDTDGDGIPDKPKIETNLGWVISAQAANTGELELRAGNEQVIKDVIPPSFNLPNGYIFVAEASGPLGALVDLTDPSTTTNGDSISAEDGSTSPIVTCIADPEGVQIPLPGTVPVGSTFVSCTAEDTEPTPNVGTWTGTILVEDNTAPVINIPGGDGATMVVAPTSPAGANVTFIGAGKFNGETITATEAISPDSATTNLSCMPASGSLFAIGDPPAPTMVSCFTTDDGPCDEANTACVDGVNRSDTATIYISVVDSDPPVINAGEPLVDITTEATDILTPVADVPLVPPLVEDPDLVDPDPTITNDAPVAGFPLSLGVPTIVEWSVEDFAGNVSTANQNVFIVDTIPPDITVPADITETSLSLSGLSIDFNVTTPLELFPDTTVCVENGTTTSIASGYLFPVGSTTVSCTATDTSGNSATDTFDVTVLFEYTPSGISGKASGKSGSSFPLAWSWNAGGTPVAVDSQSLTITTEAGACPATGLNAEDPGSSGIRLQSDGSYVYNLQAINPSTGENLPAEKGGSPYCFTVSLPTGEHQDLTLNIRP